MVVLWGLNGFFSSWAYPVRGRGHARWQSRQRGQRLVAVLCWDAGILKALNGYRKQEDKESTSRLRVRPTSSEVVARA